MLITEQQLDEWARTNGASQEVLVTLIWRLVAAAVPRPEQRRFPLQLNQPGSDGFLKCESGLPPFVPAGTSYWEIGTGIDPAKKASKDYRELTDVLSAGERADSAFVFVTPLSGQKAKWLSSPKKNGRAVWVRDRNATKEWREVVVVDGALLVDWLHHFPAVAAWFACEVLGTDAVDLEPLGTRWSLTRTIGERPPLQPSLFLTGRDQACQRLASVLKGETKHLKLDTHYPDQVVDFVAAYIANLDHEIQADAVGRCLIVKSEQAWRLAVALRDPHTLIAHTSLDLSGPEGITLIQMAWNKGHGVIFGGPKGGLPEPTRCALPSPSADQVNSELQKAGYSRERSRSLAQKSNGNLPALLRCIQNLSVLPPWAQDTAAADLALCALIGEWDESNPADREAIEKLSGKAYGGWIAAIRDAAARPGIPLQHRAGTWRFTSRYEGWHALGGRLFNEHLDRFGALVTEALGEDDPALALSVGERYLAPIHDLKHTHSKLLREGLAGGLALLGSLPEALIHCATGHAENIAARSVRTLLEPGTWQRWATLDGLLPLLAEAAPDEFLDALTRDATAFESLFAQEGDGLTGGNYLSGTLWALETLAWSPDLLGRVVLCLGELASHDPGGKWTNRPANSLRTIFLPWFPQTVATPEQQRAAVSALARDFPAAAYKLAISLLPDLHSTSFGSAKPAWRTFIPEDWSEGITRQQRWEQEAYFAKLAVELAGTDPERLGELAEHAGRLPVPGFVALLDRLGSPQVTGLPEASRVDIWQALEYTILTHRKFPDADWVMPDEQLRQLAGVTERLAPTAPALRHRRLFTERSFELFESVGNYQKQTAMLEKRRRQAVREVMADGGTSAVLDLAQSVDAPWLVGIALGQVGSKARDGQLLPDLLDSDQGPTFSFIAGYVGSRYDLRGPRWIASLRMQRWSTETKGRLLSLLPFDEPTWDLVEEHLPHAGAEYWTRTSAQPYRTHGDLAIAVDQLMAHGRPSTAVHCLHWMVNGKKIVDPVRIVAALLAAVEAPEPHRVDGHDIAELIRALQDDPATDQEGLFRVEWAYLPLLDGFRGNARPRTLEQRLAEDPFFFCEVIRLVYRSKNAAGDAEVPGESISRIAQNAYSLLTRWTIPPGSMSGRQFRVDCLEHWVDAVREGCTESGHLNVAMQTVGRVLFHSPPDPGGLWIHHGVAELLDARDGKHLRSGFQVQAYNSRGAHWVDPSGSPERELACDYREKAETVETLGLHRFGAALREIADGYDREAERMQTMHDPGA